MLKFPSRAIAALFAATALHLHAATPEAAMNAAIVPGADVQFYSNEAKVNATPIAKKISELSAKIQDLVKDKDNGDVKRLQALEQLCEAEGLGDENCESAIFSADIGAFLTTLAKHFKEESDATLSLESLHAIGAYAFKNPITPAALKKVTDEALKTFVDDNDELKRLRISDFTHGDAVGLSLTFDIPADEIDDVPFDKIPVLSAALLAGNKVLVAGLEQDVRAAIDRANAGAKAEPSLALKALIDSSLAGSPLAKHDAYAAIVIPQIVRDAVAEIEKEFSGHMPPGVLPGIQAGKVWQGLRLASAYGAKLDATINFVLDTPERATSVKDLLQINALNMAKMGLFQFAGKNTTLAENLSATTDGASTSVNLTITAEDIDFFFDMAKKKYFDAPRAPLFIEEDDIEFDE